MEKNKAEKKGTKNERAMQEQPYAVELKLLKVAHAAFLAKAWECYGDPIFVYSMMHTVHHAMMDLEQDFLEAKVTEKANGKKRDSRGH